MKAKLMIVAMYCLQLTAFSQTADTTIYHNGSILTMAGKSPA